ncbi:MAG: hypothetical protein HFJ30_04345 [Clostridia bacterium]|jgi:hypothetical protein|nr:hypothetical protein [Clostridia bacterium]MCI9413263.1 hypothetical protein [Clostridia bacterium]
MDKKEFVESIKEDLGIKTYQEMGEDANLNVKFDFNEGELEKIQQIFLKKAHRKEKKNK